MRIQAVGGSILLVASWLGFASAFIPNIRPGNSMAHRAGIQVADCAAGQCLKQNRREFHLFAAGDSYDDEPMYLSEENAEKALQMCRDELITMFGYSAENQAVGITGEVEFVELDGCEIVVRLKGRFWHDRKMVLARVANAVQQRIPEASVRIEHPSQLQGGSDDAQSVEQFYKN